MRGVEAKSEIGLELKRAYDSGDQAELRRIAEAVLPSIAAAVKELRAAHRSQWLRMFKPFGWEVIDIRYGGVLNRLDTAAVRLLDYVDGRIPAIEELEQDRLVYSSVNRFNQKGRAGAVIITAWLRQTSFSMSSIHFKFIGPTVGCWAAKKRAVGYCSVVMA